MKRFEQNSAIHDIKRPFDSLYGPDSIQERVITRDSCRKSLLISSIFFISGSRAILHETKQNPWLFILGTFRNSRQCKIDHSNWTETSMQPYDHTATSCWNLDPVPTTIAMLPESPRVLAPISKHRPLRSSLPLLVLVVTGSGVRWRYSADIVFNEIKHDSDAWLFRSLWIRIRSPSIQHWQK